MRPSTSIGSGMRLPSATTASAWMSLWRTYRRQTVWWESARSPRPRGLDFLSIQRCPVGFPLWKPLDDHWSDADSGTVVRVHYQLAGLHEARGNSAETAIYRQRRPPPSATGNSESEKQCVYPAGGIRSAELENEPRLPESGTGVPSTCRRASIRPEPGLVVLLVHRRVVGRHESCGRLH